MYVYNVCKFMKMWSTLAGVEQLCEGVLKQFLIVVVMEAYKAYPMTNFFVLQGSQTQNTEHWQELQT